MDKQSCPGLDAPGTLNHLGVEVADAAQVAAAEQRLVADGLDTTGVSDTECCFAAKTETWVEAPDGQRWEWYVKTGDVENIGHQVVDAQNGACCG